MYTGEKDKPDTCYLRSSFEGSQAFNIAYTKRKNLSNAFVSGIYDAEADLSFERYHSGFYARRIPKKRSRTASCQRHLSDMIDASSEEDTDSFQDDQIDYDLNMENHLDFESDLSKSTKTNYPKYPVK